MVKAVSEDVFPILMGGNSAFIEAIVSGRFPKKPNIGNSNNYHPNVPNRKEMVSI